ncbi:MAG: glycosyltransferase family 2 protein [Saprospiraceae bacterium]
MIDRPHIAVLIPAYNEEKSIAKVIADLPKDWVSTIVVCNNNSTDNTKANAIGAGATVVDQPNRGYGNACLKGIEYLKSLEQTPEIVVFIDGDYSDFPEELPKLVLPIIQQSMDLVIGSRENGFRQKGSMTSTQIFGNWLATTLIRWFYGYHFTDLGPFRAIRWNTLVEMKMEDKNYGWTVEMQIKAAKMKLQTCEVSVNYRPRIGISKVSGTLKGSFLAGYKILLLIFKNLFY